ncbi:MAG: hypothetical protein ABSB57_01380 [Dehalococcoidia bacterium]
MQKWEYKAIVEKDHQRAEAAMNEAGEEGWEAFAAIIWAFGGALIKGGSHLIWLKRPKPA